jgi:hypothetical protein
MIPVFVSVSPKADPERRICMHNSSLGNDLRIVRGMKK